MVEAAAAPPPLNRPPPLSSAFQAPMRSEKNTHGLTNATTGGSLNTQSMTLQNRDLETD